MISKVVSEAQLRKRLQEAGTTSDEIEQLIDQYLEASRSELPNEEAISTILQKTQDDRTFRVGAFRLTKEQYDALLSYYEDSGKLVPGQPVDAGSLVQNALSGFIALIS